MSGYRFCDNFVENAAKCRVTDFVTFSFAKMCQNAATCRVSVSGVHCVPRRVLDSDSRAVRQIALIVTLGSPETPKCRVTDCVTLSVAKMCQNAAKCRVRRRLS